MCNSIFISDKTIPKAKEGEEFELTIKGTYETDENGVRKLDVSSIDGKDVVDPDQADCGCDGGDQPDLMDQNAEDALRIFILKKKK